MGQGNLAHYHIMKTQLVIATNYTLNAPEVYRRFSAKQMRVIHSNFWIPFKRDNPEQTAWMAQHDVKLRIQFKPQVFVIPLGSAAKSKYGQRIPYDGTLAGIRSLDFDIILYGPKDALIAWRLKFSEPKLQLLTL